MQSDDTAKARERCIGAKCTAAKQRGLALILRSWLLLAVLRSSFAERGDNLSPRPRHLALVLAAGSTTASQDCQCAHDILAAQI